MQPEDLELFARNCGNHHDQHINWAQNKAPLTTWERHVRSVILPQYRREFDQPWEGLSKDEIAGVARVLKHHYEQHVKEMARHGCNS